MVWHDLIRWMRWCRDQNFARFCWAEVPNFQISLSALSKSWFQIELSASNYTAETLRCSFIAWHVSNSYKQDWNCYNLKGCAILTTATGNWIPGYGLTTNSYYPGLSNLDPQILNELNLQFTSSRITFVRFLVESKTPKRHFEINWPLVFRCNPTMLYLW